MMNQTTEIKIGDVIEGKEILKIAKLPHKGDSHLRVVFTKFRDQYVSFLYNMSAPGFHHGRYADTEEEGNQNFKEHSAHYKIKE